VRPGRGAAPAGVGDSCCVELLGLKGHSPIDTSKTVIEGVVRVGVDELAAITRHPVPRTSSNVYLSACADGNSDCSMQQRGQATHHSSAPCSVLRCLCGPIGGRNATSRPARHRQRRGRKHSARLVGLIFCSAGCSLHLRVSHRRGHGLRGRPRPRLAGIGGNRMGRAEQAGSVARTSDAISIRRLLRRATPRPAEIMNVRREAALPVATT
jgi:hypothetical protein